MHKTDKRHVIAVQSGKAVVILIVVVGHFSAPVRIGGHLVFEAVHVVPVVVCVGEVDGQVIVGSPPHVVSFDAVAAGGFHQAVLAVGHKFRDNVARTAVFGFGGTGCVLGAQLFHFFENSAVVGTDEQLGAVFFRLQGMHHKAPGWSEVGRIVCEARRHQHEFGFG